MSAEEAERGRVRALVKLGVNQKVIASRMGVSATWLSKWLNQKPKTSALTLAASERLQQFGEELATVALGLRAASEIVAAAMHVDPRHDHVVLAALRQWGRPGAILSHEGAPTPQTTRRRSEAKRAR